VVKHQTLCFSATFSDEVKKLGRSLLNDPVEVTVESQHSSEIIIQHFYKINAQMKNKAVLIFCNTKDACRRVSSDLKNSGIHCLELHGDLEQRERTEVLVRFSNGSTRILVATDVAARGLDIENLEMIINYDLPFETETYIHRIGRTGRAGKEGLAFSFVKANEDFRLNEINEFTNNSFNSKDLNLDKKIEISNLEPSFITLSINGGRKNKISPGDVLGALTIQDGISGKDVGRIDRQDNLTFVAVKRNVSERAFSLLENGKIKGRKFKAMINDL
jgi:ATP-independent RNA helicase DbpA